VSALASKGPETRGGAPESVGEVLRRLFPEVRPAAVRRRHAIADAWERAAGPDLAGETRPATLQRGVLVVEVRSAALLAELQGFRTAELLARLVEAEGSGRVTGLRFRPGVF
jgi:predicted nucleic acid-binding Zn ribbon protein